MNRQLKEWKEVLSLPYQHGQTGGNKNLSLHQMVFFAVAVITQIQIDNKEINLFSCEEYDDSFNDFKDCETH